MKLAHLLTTSGDLPLPAWLFAWGAGIVLVVSFFGLAAGWRKPRLTDDHWRPIAPRISSILGSGVARALAGFWGILVLGLVIATGLWGTETTDRNFSVTFVFVTFWIGLPVVCAVLGDVFPAFDPWRSVARLTSRLTGSRWRPPLDYPTGLGLWPSAILLLGFVWLELIYSSSNGGLTLTPGVTAIAASSYTIFTLTMMALFGAETWSRNGELFSGLSRMYSALSPFEWRDGTLGRRRFLSGAPVWSRSTGSAAMVLAAIAATTYDGAQQGALTEERHWLSRSLVDLGLDRVPSAWIVDTGLLLATFALVGSVYAVGVAGMRRVPDSPESKFLRISFAHTLIPIALAYVVAHYFSYFIDRIQGQFTFLISDPFGTGWNLIGLTDVDVGSGLLSTTLVWYLQLLALVTGHVVALMLAHDRSISIWKKPRYAARSQYWMLAVMVFLTVFGLYLLSAVNI